MSNRVRVGLVGADASGRGWGPVAHIPALRSVDDVELAALCTSRPESARAAADAYGVERVFHDVADMAAEPDIDVIAVVVRVPHHLRVVMPALEAGKPVMCEWPLGVNSDEAAQMAELARAKGVVTGIGLQGRQDPTLTRIKELVETGWLGDVLSVRVSLLSGGATRHSSDAWMGERRNGANTLSIVGGHTIDYVEFCFGALTELSATVATQIPQWHLSDTGDVVTVDAPDNVVLGGALTGGGLVSFQVASVPFHGPGWRMEAYGTEGTIVASTPVMPQITPITLLGARGDQPLEEMAVPEPAAGPASSLPDGPAANIARAYRAMAAAVREGAGFAPDFEHARRLHQILDAMESSSTTGRTVPLGEPDTSVQS